MLQSPDLQISAGSTEHFRYLGESQSRQDFQHQSVSRSISRSDDADV